MLSANSLFPNERKETFPFAVETVHVQIDTVHTGDAFPFQNLEVLRTELELKALRSSIDDPELRQRQREQVEQLKIELDSSQSHLMGLKHELLKTQVRLGGSNFSTIQSRESENLIALTRRLNLQSDALGLQRGCDAQHQRKNLLVRQSAELDAECQRRERQCKELRRQVEEVRMEESLINLEIRRRENVLQLQSEAVDDLENQRQHIENVRFTGSLLSLFCR